MGRFGTNTRARRRVGSDFRRRCEAHAVAARVGREHLRAWIGERRAPSLFPSRDRGRVTRPGDALPSVGRCSQVSQDSPGADNGHDVAGCVPCARGFARPARRHGRCAAAPRPAHGALSAARVAAPVGPIPRDGDISLKWIASGLSTSGHNCARRRVVVPNAVLFREIAPADSAPICRPLPPGRLKPASATSGPFDVGREHKS
jgi:hypothetical protein